MPVGSIESVLLDPLTTPDDMALWLDTYEELTGEAFAFLHIDTNWVRPDWPETLRGIEAVADERGVPFGILYNGGAETTSTGWLQATAENIAAYEVNAGGTPQHISFQSWVDQPDHVLPEDDLGAFTSIVNRYYGTRAVIDSVAVIAATDESPAVLRGRVADLDGMGLGGQEIYVEVTALTGGIASASASGIVPADTTEALIAVRVNVEDATPGETNVEIHDVGYFEAGDPTNRVPNGDFTSGNESWDFRGEPQGDATITGANGSMLLAARPDQVVYVNGASFPVTPGAMFDLRATFGFGDNDSGVGVLSAIFLNPDTRVNIKIEPVARDLRPVTTDAAGNFVLDLPTLAGASLVDITSVGDLHTWPALYSTTVGLDPPG